MTGHACSYRIPWILRLVALGALTTTFGACSVYESARRDQRELEASGGTAGNGGGGAAGAAGMGGAGVGGTPSPTDASSNDLSNDDDWPDAGRFDTSGDVASVDAEPGSDGGADTAETGLDVAWTDAQDVTTIPDSASSDGDAPATFDVTGQDAGGGDVIDSGGPTSQTLPLHGLPLVNPDAGGGPFQSRCAADEVVTGFVGRAGAQTDALGATCTKIVGGVLGASRNLPLNGNTTGGSAVTIACPANYVAVGFVGRFGYCTTWKEDLLVGLGVVCRDLGSSSTQTVAITSQPTLDSGYTSFREDCTGGRYLTSFSGQLDSNSLGRCVQQLGGECNVR